MDQVTTDSRSDQPLAGRRALVTGGATGIGRATCLRLAADGAAVMVDHVGDEAPARDLVEEIEAAGGRAAAVEGDVASEEDVAAMFEAAGSAFGGPVDLLVNNAGVETPYSVVDMPLEEWERVIGVNLTGAFLCSRAAARGMLEADIGGAIVNVTSVHEQIPWPTYAHYCASKAGVKLMAQTLARELAPNGIRVANIAPGAILTPINKSLSEDVELRDQVLDEIPLGRFGEPEEIAAAIAWVAGPEAGYVTGATLFVDGGMTLYPRFV